MKVEGSFYIISVFPRVSFPDSSDGKESACNAGDLGSIPRSGRSLEKGMATHSGILACRIPWTESMGLLRVGHDGVTSTLTSRVATVTCK